MIYKISIKIHASSQIELVTCILYVQLTESFRLFSSDVSQISIVIRIAYSLGSACNRMRLLCLALLLRASPTFRERGFQRD